MPSYVMVKSSDAFSKLFHGKRQATYDGPGLYNKVTGYMMDLPQTDEICAPMVMPDIREFIATAHRGRPQRITSRSILGRYERSNNIRQAGDFKPGEIIGEVRKRREKEANEAIRLANETGLRGPVEHCKWT